ncbi:helix-turn-helix domain-containing protein [Tomitella fengzijianii]|uniref:Transcriptional regulator n=1 Tax=Tomitella fengzijianii TaxID=2597660 RepID=A0A516X7T6_9ACTN|nr:helix-turn-helix domain-containing protein [Tomitella fengzijianii]QDQ99083.1 transcriptional regulator [Tomitella fengzijianii]
MRPGEDAAAVARRLGEAHERFVTRRTGVAGGDAADADGDAQSDGDVRAVVLESWERSRRSGVDPEATGASLALTGADLREYRSAHPLSTMLPVVRRLLVEDAVDSGLLVAISDSLGRLLWVEGDASMRDRAADMAFAEGADWSEATIGTNAPGTSLALDHCVQLFGAEHFARPARRWSCAAAPVHDPATGAILGSIDITGGMRVAAPEVLTLVRATVAAAEAELRLHAVAGGGAEQPGAPSVDGGLATFPGADAPAARRLRVLGRDRPTLRHAGGELRLSPRHAEILVLLTEYPDGMGAEQLAVQLDERSLDSVTVRAEMSRLRRVLGVDTVASRPYRLTGEVLTDVMAVRGALGRGDVAGALRLYRGPVLPDSLAPGVSDVRDSVDARMREAVLRSGDPSLVQRWATTSSGRDDQAVWQSLVAAFPVGSPAFVQAKAHADLLERRFGRAATRLQRPRA